MILLAEELGCGKVVAAVAGGETRAESVRIGVGEVGDDAAVILVHDAARPLRLRRGGRAAARSAERGLGRRRARAAASPTRSSASTATRSSRRSPRDELVSRADAAGVRRAGAARGGRRRASSATDCVVARRGRGGRVKVVEGDPRLLKVTTPDDLALVESWLGRRA